MAKSSALTAAQQRIVALEAQLDVANRVCGEQRTRIAALQAQLAAPGRVVIERHGQRTVKRYPAGATS